ncbi:MAG TPA: T9SS type A sorting domain-containing protein, partial [Flavobacteriales bacterium]|nr:T9SS type A sorting domain-containing protein [Flavobacteriales bacterium]
QSILGEQLIKQQVSSTEDIDISELSSGTYFLQLGNDFINLVIQ